MLAPAIVHEAELRVRYRERVADAQMRHYLFQSYLDYDLVIDRNDWKRIQFVSVGPSKGVVAYMEAQVNRESLVVEDFLVTSLQAGGLSLGASVDVLRFIAYLFEGRGFRKLFFRFVQDHPFGPKYVRFLRDLARCGSIQGVLPGYVTLSDGCSYNLVIMEVHRQAFLEWFSQHHALRCPA